MTDKQPTETPITEADLLRLSRAFYVSVRADDLLAPVFKTKINDTDKDWDEHSQHIASFWSSVMLKTGRFEGNPMRKHLSLPQLTPEHFVRWLALFETAALKTLDEDKAKAMLEIANRIAASFQMGIAFHREKQGDMDHPFAGYGLPKKGR